jgi:hypothetical protein
MPFSLECLMLVLGLGLEIVLTPNLATAQIMQCLSEPHNSCEPN